MGRVSATKKVVLEEFPDQRDWIGKLLDPINEFFTKMLSAVNGGLVFGQNITGMEREFDFVYTGASSLPSFVWTITQKPTALTVVSAFENNPSTNREFTPVIVLLSWNLLDENEVVVSDAVLLSSGSASVASLTSGRRYKIKVRVTP